MGDLLLDHVREEEVWYHGDRDDVSTLVDQLGNLLVLQTNHVLAVHLKFKKKFIFYFIFNNNLRESQGMHFYQRKKLLQKQFFVSAE